MLTHASSLLSYHFGIIPIVFESKCNNPRPKTLPLNCMYNGSHFYQLHRVNDVGILCSRFSVRCFKCRHISINEVNWTKQLMHGKYNSHTVRFLNKFCRNVSISNNFVSYRLSWLMYKENVYKYTFYNPKQNFRFLIGTVRISNKCAVRPRCAFVLHTYIY